MKKLFVIILDFKGGKKLLDCLESIRLAKIPTNWEKQVLVIDNNRRNLGFSQGCNLGIKKALKQKATAVLLLNQDTVVNNEFLGPLLKNQADIVAPVIRFKRQGKWVDDFGGKVNWWLGRTKHIEKFSIFNLPVRPCLPTGRQAGFQFLNIDYVSGCAMLIRRPVLEKIGLLDEGYFLYFEDVDFCLRAKKAGFKIAVEPKSVITHKIVEGKKKPLWQRWELAKSNLKFINRWLCWWRKPIAWIYWLFLCIKLLF